MVRFFTTLLIATSAISTVSAVPISISPEEAVELYQRGFFRSLRNGIKKVAKIARPALPLIGAVNPVLGAAVTAAQFIREEPQQLHLRDVDDELELQLRWLEDSGLDIRDLDTRSWWKKFKNSFHKVTHFVSNAAKTVSNVADKVAPIVQTASQFIRDEPHVLELYSRDFDDSELDLREFDEPELSIREFNDPELQLAARWLEANGLDIRDLDNRNWLGDMGKNLGNVAKFAGNAAKTAGQVAKAATPYVKAAMPYVKTAASLILRDGPNGPELYVRDLDGSEIAVRELDEHQLSLREFDDSQLELATRWFEANGLDIRDLDNRNWFGDIGKNLGNVAKFAGNAVKTGVQVAKAATPYVKAAMPYVKTAASLIVRDGPNGPELFVRDLDGSEIAVRELDEHQLSLREFDDSQLGLATRWFEANGLDIRDFDSRNWFGDIGKNLGNVAKFAGNAVKTGVQVAKAATPYVKAAMPYVKTAASLIVRDGPNGPELFVRDLDGSEIAVREFNEHELSRREFDDSQLELAARWFEENGLEFALRDLEESELLVREFEEPELDLREFDEPELDLRDFSNGLEARDLLLTSGNPLIFREENDSLVGREYAELEELD